MESRLAQGVSSERSTDEGWQICLEEMRKHDNGMIERWNEEIDTLLLFAALFSAVVTTFVVDSYKNLQPDQQELSTRALSQISAQLSSFSLSSGFLNATHPPISYTDLTQTFSPSPSDVRVNILWFTSLVFSLVTALFGIFARQWLRHYGGWEVSSARQSVRLRQLRFDGLKKWRIAHIMTILPLLLQIALVLFFAGVVELLWALHKTLARVVTILIGASIVLLLASAIAPIFDQSCPYRSPLSWVLYRLCVPLVWILGYVEKMWIVLLLTINSRHFRGSFYFNLALKSDEISQSLTKEMPSEWTSRDIQALSYNTLSSKASRCDIRALTWIHGSHFDLRLREQGLLQTIADLTLPDQACLVFDFIAVAYGTSRPTFLSRLRGGPWRPPVPHWGILPDMYLRMGMLTYSLASERNTYVLNSSGGITRFDVLLLLNLVQARCSRATMEGEYWPFLVSKLDDISISAEESYQVSSAIIDMIDRYPGACREQDMVVLLDWTGQTRLPDDDKPLNVSVLDDMSRGRVRGDMSHTYETVVSLALRACASVIERQRAGFSAYQLPILARKLLDDLLRQMVGLLLEHNTQSYRWHSSLLSSIDTIDLLRPSVVPPKLVELLRLYTQAARLRRELPRHYAFRRLGELHNMTFLGTLPGSRVKLPGAVEDPLAELSPEPFDILLGEGTDTSIPHRSADSLSLPYADTHDAASATTLKRPGSPLLVPQRWTPADLGPIELHNTTFLGDPGSESESEFTPVFPPPLGVLESFQPPLVPLSLPARWALYDGHELRYATFLGDQQGRYESFTPPSALPPPPPGNPLSLPATGQLALQPTILQLHNANFLGDGSPGELSEQDILIPPTP